MPVAEVLDLLRCPVCGSSFSLAGSGVRCPHGHAFDVARQGYLNLLRSRPPRHADTAEMVSARERFLGGGHYAAVAAGLGDLVRSGLAALRPGRASSAPALLDAGAGSGYYLRELLDALGGRGLALDVSVAAARRAARAHPQVAAVVADTWRPLPVADGCLDAVVCVFAPRNPAEFARVLRPDGVLVVAGPLPAHLRELRQPLALLEVEEDKQERLAASLADAFAPLETREVHRRVRWSGPVVLDLVAMGPNAFHVDPGELAARVARLPQPVEVGVAVQVSSWRPRPG